MTHAPAKLPSSIPGHEDFTPDVWAVLHVFTRQRIFDAIYNEAREAAIKAAADVPDRGACGFGWVEFSPATHPFIRHMKATGRGRRNHKPGWVFWNPGEYRGQAVDGVEAGATAFAKVLKEYWPDLSIWACSRLD